VPGVQDADRLMAELGSVGKILNDIISSSLGGPGGDPDYYHELAAARAFVALKMLDLHVDREENVRCGLRNIPYKPGTKDEENGNICKIDFLSEVGWPPEMD